MLRCFSGVGFPRTAGQQNREPLAPRIHWGCGRAMYKGDFSYAIACDRCICIDPFTAEGSPKQSVAFFFRYGGRARTQVACFLMSCVGSAFDMVYGSYRTCGTKVALSFFCASLMVLEVPVLCLGRCQPTLSIRAEGTARNGGLVAHQSVRCRQKPRLGHLAGCGVEKLCFKEAYNQIVVGFFWLLCGT